ncbi:MAG: hypothetical protein IKC87_04360 [Clostridia bacterium]|nr:hypothetical protein [Clostridia bacterium]
MLKSLIAIRFNAMFFGGRGANGNNKKQGIGKRIGAVAIITFVILTMLLFFTSIAATLAEVFVPKRLDAPYFAIFNILTFGMIFVLSIFETKSELFECKDNELLLSMPIPPSYIVLSRSLSVLLLNIGEAMVVALPALVVFVVYGGSPWVIPTVIITAILLAMVATALSSGVGYIVAIIAQKFKNNTLVPVLLSIAFIVLYIFGYNAMLDSLFMLEGDSEMSADVLNSTFGAIGFLGRISLPDPLFFITFVVISVGITLLAWLIISKNYISIISTKSEGAKKKYVKEKLERSSAFIALSKKELAMFLTNATYILNGAIGSLFSVIAAIFAVSSRDMLYELLGMLGFASDTGFVPVLLSALLFGFASMTTVSASAISLEGKNFWILKTAPIPPMTLIMAKLVPHVVVTVPVSLISSLILLIGLGVELVYWPLVIFVPIIGCMIFAMLGLILNIAMPKFVFTNSAEVVKSSMPVFILTMGGLIFLMGISGLVFFCCFTLGSLVTALMFAAITVLLFLVMYLILTGPSLRRLSEL